MKYMQFHSVNFLESVLLCRNKITRESLGYGYLTFKKAASARKAFNKYNNKIWFGRLLILRPAEGFTQSVGTDTVLVEYSESLTGFVFTEHSIKETNTSTEESVTQVLVSMEEATTYDHPSLKFASTTQFTSAETMLAVANIASNEGEINIVDYIFPRVKEMYPEFVGRITGVLLGMNMDYKDQLKLMSDQSFFKRKVDEAMSSLSASAGQSTSKVLLDIKKEETSKTILDIKKEEICGALLNIKKEETCGALLNIKKEEPFGALLNIKKEETCGVLLEIKKETI
ncbi:hypothetical protein Anas_03594 [Armadillidium nasatum]|uniref:PABC domain-containing protein n=1 Tax=Armadillidium nasatum TaxID=96803 RepID=A0A5N5SX23_9CRUS|nr:hypothetical protein Anas_03594 [Armadillidium nasatum]